MQNLRKLEKVKVESLKFTGWIAEKDLRNVRILTSKPIKGKFVEVMIEFVPIRKENK